MRARESALTDAVLITTRDVRPSETALLMGLTLRCWTGTVAADSSLYRETPDHVASLLASPEGGAVFALIDGEPVGAGRYFRVPGPEGDARPWIELKRVGMLPEFRKLGLGQKLVAAVEDRARARLSPAGAQLGVRADQPRLIEFWRTQGYALADDVSLHTVNPLTPPPTTMRKWFSREAE
jgi:GNAT superfamily N-acetyltransferase